MPFEEVEDPLLWWSKHEGQFPTNVVLARAILGKPSSHIETKKVFSIASILIGFVIVDLVQRTWIS
jgi:hypothetical protein